MSTHDDIRMKDLPAFGSESGQTMSEYAVVLLLLVPGAILVFTGLGTGVTTAITSVARLLP
jgi:Flp pilus assembly pilin Flp